MTTTDTTPAAGIIAAAQAMKELAENLAIPMTPAEWEVVDAVPQLAAAVVTLAEALEKIRTMPNKPGYHNTWLGRWIAARETAEDALTRAAVAMEACDE